MEPVARNHFTHC